MRIAIDHETVYSYDEPSRYSAQSLRLTPPSFDGQAVISWTVEGAGAGQMPVFADCYGNMTHTLVLERPHDEVRIRAYGEVRTADTSGIVTGLRENFPPAFYLRETRLTRADGALRALARTCQSAAGGDDIEFLHRLMMAIRDAIDYRKGETGVATQAAEALAHGYGVCQDHAHVFIAGARALGIPARYVSGYLLSNGETAGGNEAGHAWAEALVPELGWIGFDVANRLSPTDAYVRIATGLDYQDAAPIRGVQRGGLGEKMTVLVRVGSAECGENAQ